MVVFFFTPGTAEGDRVLASVRAVADSLEGVGVAAVGVALSADERAVRETLDRHRIAHPVHVDPRTAAAPLARQWGFSTGNGIALLDPRGRVALADVPPAQLEVAVRRQLQLTPPEPLPADRKADATRTLDLAEALIRRDHPRAAARVLARLHRDARLDPELAQRHGQLMLALESAVPALVALTERLFEADRPGEAVILLEQLAAALGDSPARVVVDEQLASFLDDPELRDKVESQRPLAHADDLLAFADELAALGSEVAALGSEVEAYRLYHRLLEESPDTPAAEEARRRIQRLEADPQRRAQLRDQLAGTAAQRLLQQARAYRSAGLHDRAREFYERVLREHPGTSAAEEAQRDLAGY